MADDRRKIVDEAPAPSAMDAAWIEHQFVPRKVIERAEVSRLEWLQLCSALREEIAK